jgi:hypothetical protein
VRPGRWRMTGSQQVSWEETHRFIEAVLTSANFGLLPWAGTPEWCAMSDGDPRKLLALALSGEHHVLRVEVAQTALAEASRAVSGAASWSNVSREMQRRKEFYASRPWMRRKPA